MGSVLSKKERRFLLTPNSFDSKNQKEIKYRLRKKIKVIGKDIQILMQYCKNHNIDVSTLQKSICVQDSLKDIHLKNTETNDDNIW